MPSKEIDRPYKEGYLLLPDDSGQLEIEDAQIIFRNFAGVEQQYNRAGDRNFSVILPEDIVEDMRADGWNVKQLKPRDDETPGDYYLQVSVKFENRPPNIMLIRGPKMIRLEEDMVEILDQLDIARAHLLIRPYRWDVNGNQGVKAYTKSLAIHVALDPVEEAYAELEESKDVPTVEQAQAPVVGHTENGEPIYGAELED